MGGRVAEELIFHQLTTGASNDIQVATDLARKMVCDWGMSEKLGPLHFGKREGEVFLGRDFGDAGKDYSEQTAIEIDAEVRTIVTANYDRAKKVVMENLDKLKVLAEALLEYETVDGAEIDTIFAGGASSVSRRSPVVAARPRAARPRPPRSRRGPASSRRRGRCRTRPSAGARSRCAPRLGAGSAWPPTAAALRGEIGPAHPTACPPSRSRRARRLGSRRMRG